MMSLPYITWDVYCPFICLASTLSSVLYCFMLFSVKSEVTKI